MLSNVLAETRDRSAYILLKTKSRKSCRKLRLFFCALWRAQVGIGTGEPRFPPSSGIGQPTIGRPFNVQAKGQLRLTWRPSAGSPQSEGSSVDQLKGRPFYGQAKGGLWPTRAFYAECAQVRAGRQSRNADFILIAAKRRYHNSRPEGPYTTRRRSRPQPAAPAAATTTL